MSVIEKFVETDPFTYLQLRRFETTQYLERPTADNLPIQANRHHFVTSPRSFESFEQRGEFDPPEPREKMWTRQIDAGQILFEESDELEGLAEETAAKGNDQSAGSDFEDSPSADGESDSPVNAFKGERNTPAGQMSEQATDGGVSQRLDAIDQLFAALAYEGLGDEDDARTAVPAGENNDFDGTALTQTVALATIVGAAVPMVSPNEWVAAGIGFDKNRRKRLVS